MTRSREIFQMENSQSGSEKSQGFRISKKQTLFYVLLSVLACVLAAWLSHFFTRKFLLKSESDSIKNCDYSPEAEERFDKPRQEEWRKEKSETEEKIKDVRLPDSVIPDFYQIKLIPFVWENNFTFSGEVKILMNVTRETNNITLHVNDLEIDSDSVRLTKKDGGKNIGIRSLRNDTQRQFFVTDTEEALTEGDQYEIEMKFTGHLNDKLQGFYRSSYNVGTDKRWIATTQFQATDARRAIPCFDEPALKSKFKLFIGRPTNMTSISNMPQLNNGRPIAGLPNYVWDEYQESVPMSTYLVAFVVSDFKKITDGKKFSAWAREAAIGQAKYSLEIGPKILNYFENYFGIDFPLPKVDMVALPDFGGGAMENWGLITFRETALLYEEGVSSRDNKQNVAMVVSHELAHQWFGNLVTPSWWSDLWLNEGFASYVEYIGVEAVEPSWKIMEQFVIHEIQDVFALDALRTSHQISVKVHNPDEITEIFDRISYGKGASLIRMMDHFLTPEVFKRGLSKYLKRHKFSSTDQDDLWRALTEQAHEDSVMATNMSVKTIMDTWTLQTGFPLVTVKRDYERENAVVSQDRFLLFKSSSKTVQEKTEKVLWWIPITYTTSRQLNFNSTYPSHWLKREEKISIGDLPSQDDWVIFNIQQTGFYRVNYDERNWRNLIDYLRDPSSFANISPVNRAQLVDDALNLARAELLSYDLAMNVTLYLANELEYLPWKSAFNGFSYLDNMLIKTGGYDKFKKYVLKITEKLYQKVGFETSPRDPQLTIYKRTHVLHWSCSLGHQNCVKNSVVQYQKWKKMADPDKDNPISPDLKSVVYCTAIKVGNEEDWNFAWERFKTANVASEKDLLLEALGCSRDVAILSRVLDWSLTENSGIRKQDAGTLFGSVSANPFGQILAFNLLTEQWHRLKTYFGNSLFSIDSIVKSATKTINTKSQLKQLSDFAREYGNEFGPANRAVNQALEQADANIRWMDQNYDSLIKWLSNAVS